MLSPLSAPSLFFKDIENAPGYMLDIYDDATVTFMGKFRGSKVNNVRSLFYSSGNLE